MKVEIKIPSVGESVTESTISHILKENGSFVKADEEILELETDKVNQVVYAPASGKLTLSVQTGQTVSIGSVIGFIDTEVAEKPPSASKPATPTPAPKIAQQPPPEKAPSATPKASSKSPKSNASPSSTPSVRQMADHFLSSSPSGVSSETPVVSEGVQMRKKMSKLRKTIAERLVAVKNQTAMLTTFNEVDMSAIIAIRSKEQESFQKKSGVKLGFMSFFVKATVAALKEFPEVNSMIEGEEIVTFQNYDIGVAVSTDRGLLVPVLRNCDQMSFGEIEKSLADFAQKAREGSISIDDLRGGSFTITNGGVFGSLLSTPILNPPQSAILGMHSITKRPVAFNEQIAIRPMMYLALSYDHRLIDGREAVQFLVHLKSHLEDPTRLLLDL